MFRVILSFSFGSDHSPCHGPYNERFGIEFSGGFILFFLHNKRSVSNVYRKVFGMIIIISIAFYFLFVSVSFNKLFVKLRPIFFCDGYFVFI